MDIFSCAPAPFLPSGTEPAIPWTSWSGMFDNYLTAIGGTEFSTERRRAILLTCLGAEGQRIFESLPAAIKDEGEDDFAFTKRASPQRLFFATDKRLRGKVPVP